MLALGEGDARVCVLSHSDPMGCSPQGSSMGFSRHEHWSGLPSPSPGDLPDPGIEPGSPALQANSLPAELLGEPRERG